MVIKGIKKRWIFNSLGFTIGVFTVLVISFALIVRGYFYSGIQQTIKSRTNELYDIFKGYSAQTNSEFIDIAKVYVANFSDDNIMELMIFDENNNVVITSMGFLPENPEVRPDYEQARSSTNGFGIWEGKFSSGEKLMAVTRCLYDQSNKYIGAVRYVVSVEKANSRITSGSLLLLFIGMVVIAPRLRTLLDIPTGLSALSGALLLGLISIPTIVSVAEDALDAVQEVFLNLALHLDDVFLGHAPYLPGIPAPLKFAFFSRLSY